MKRKPAVSPKKQEWPSHAEDGSLTLALTHVDSLLERIRTRKLKTFEPTLLEPLRKLTKEQIKSLNSQYRKCLEDMKAAIGGDDFFIEAYSNYEKGEMKVACELFKSLKTLKHDETATGKIRVGHGPRKRKQKPPAEVVKKVLFLEKDKETGISSLQPVDLVGASKMWVYNTKTRKLGCYNALNASGLSAKGTTILNYNTKTSLTKTIRKPKVQVHDFISKADMQKSWDAIRAVPQEISPRMNRDSLILRIFA